jgi:VWFA-related protein
MRRSFRWLQVLVVILSVLPISLSRGQNTAPPQLQPRSAEPEKASSPPPLDRQIELSVQVTDKSGAPVRGLQKEDFTVLDDKRPQNILSFRAIDEQAGKGAVPPLEIILVVDAVNASFQAVTYERSELKKFLLQNGGKLAQPVSLVFFADVGSKIQQGSSRDGNALSALYDQYETGLRIINRSQGFYGAADRFTLSLQMLTSLVDYESKRPGRKLMIWFSPGWPLLTGPSIEYTRKDEEGFFNSIVATSNEMRRANITLYSIDPLGLADAGGVRISYYEEFLKGVKFAGQAQAANLSLQVFAVQSGGRVLNSSNDITAEIAKCTSDADPFYVLSFEAAHADHANEYHAIDVKVDKPGAKARTRTGYYAQP